MKRVVVHTSERVGAAMAGPGIRSYWFARELARSAEVTLMVREGSAADIPDVEVAIAPSSDRDLARALARFDVVVTQLLPIATMHKLDAMHVPVVYDLYNLYLAEPLASLSARSPRSAELLFLRTSNLARSVSLQTGAAFLCASERQRDFWVGFLATLGRVDENAYAKDPTLRALIDVVPTGVPPDPPVRQGPVLKGVVEGIARDDRVLLWAGGVWNWLDPLTVIRAVGELASHRHDVKLVFLGIGAPNRVEPELQMAGRALQLAEAEGLRDRCVFFNRGWVPYAERSTYLLEADIGVSAHFDTLETRFAFRGRLLDHFWAGLPTISTRGDVLSELAQARGIGRTVDFEDVDAWVEAIEDWLADPDPRTTIARGVERVREELAWSRAVVPLAHLIETTEAPSRDVVRTSSAFVDHHVLRARTAIALGGIRAAAARQIAKTFDGRD